MQVYSNSGAPYRPEGSFWGQWVLQIESGHVDNLRCPSIAKAGPTDLPWNTLDQVRILT